MTNLVPAVNGQRMSSREIAEVMEKQHFHVMRDVKSLVEQGAINQSNFGLVDYKDAKGEMRSEYLLDFDATMTLITGYDAVRRSKIIRRWRELETGEAQPALVPSKPQDLQPIARQFRAALSMARAAGLDKNQAVISANHLTRRITGADPLGMLEITHLVATVQERHYTATQLGELLGGLSPQQANKMLASAGLQQKEEIGGSKMWQPTDKGKKYAVLVDTTKRHNSGAMVQQVRWLESVVNYVGGQA